MMATAPAVLKMMMIRGDTMCDKHSSVNLKINGRKIPIRLDNCIVETIKCLRSAGIKTLACCCGHGKYPKTVVIEDSEGRIKELYTLKIIPRKKRFYVTDDDGIYYLPEVCK